MTNKILDVSKDRIYAHSYGRYFSNGVLAIATILIITGIALIVSNLPDQLLLYLLGLILIGIGIIIFIPTELFQVNFRTREYRNCIKFFKHEKGEWKRLKNVQYLSIITQKKTITMSRPSLLGASVDHNVEDCNLRFYIKAGYYIDIDDFNYKASAIKVGSKIAQGLDLKLLDATIRPPLFI